MPPFFPTSSVDGRFNVAGWLDVGDGEPAGMVLAPCETNVRALFVFVFPFFFLFFIKFQSLLRNRTWMGVVYV